MKHLSPTSGMALAIAVVASLTLPALAAPSIGGCQLFPANHVLNTRVDTLPVHPRSAAWVANVSPTGDGATRSLYMDFNSTMWPEPPDPAAAPIGIPMVTVGASQPQVPVSLTWADESDAGPYPVPPNAPIEGVGPPDAQGDRHVLVVDSSRCKVFELYNAWPQANGSWKADSGAVFDLASNALRPAGWTSADAAGLSIVHGLVRYDEIASGLIEHALRFTAQRTQRAYVWPARHYASSVTDVNVAPMGARFRLKSTVDISRFTGEARIIAQAMKTYGMILADNGSSWFVSGTPDSRWNPATLAQLKALKGADFEVVDTSSLMADANSAAVAGSGGGGTTPPGPTTPAATSTSLASSANPSVAGASVTFTASVSSSAGTPSGTVAFRDNGTAIAGCSAVTLASGRATCTTSALSQGSHPLTAAYAGSTSFAASTSGTLSQVVNAPAPQPQPQPTTVTLSVARVGKGTVTSTDGHIQCGQVCSTAMAPGSSITLNASAGRGYAFAGWSGGGCSGTGSCTVTPTANTQVTATFRKR